MEFKKIMAYSLFVAFFFASFRNFLLCSLTYVQKNTLTYNVDS